MLSLLEMQRSTIGTLIAESLATDNRQYSLACTQMVEAMKAYALGDKALMDLHVTCAVKFWKRAQEDMHGQVARAQAVRAVVQSNGAELDPTVAGGKRVVKTGMSKLALWDLSWGTR